MITTSRLLPSLAIGVPLALLLGAHTSVEMLVLATVLIGIGVAPAAACRVLMAVGAVLWATRSAGGPSGDDLVDASRDAFVGALHCGAGLAAALATAGAVLALRLLRPSQRRLVA